MKKNAEILVKKPKKGGIIVTKINSRIAGYLLYYFVNKRNKELSKCMFLSELYVRIAYRNKGIGTRLIKEALNTKAPYYINKFVVTADDKARRVIKLYKGLGFSAVGKTKASNIILKRTK